MEDKRSKYNEVSRKMWKAVETKIGKTRVVKTKEKREKKARKKITRTKKRKER